MRKYKLEYKSELGAVNSAYVGENELATAITCLQELKFPEQELTKVELIEESDINNMLTPDTFGMIISYGYTYKDLKKVFVPEGKLEHVLKSLHNRRYIVNWDKWTNRVLAELDLPIMEG